jgi:hypothetical protein
VQAEFIMKSYFKLKDKKNSHRKLRVIAYISLAFLFILLGIAINSLFQEECEDCEAIRIEEKEYWLEEVAEMERIIEDKNLKISGIEEKYKSLERYGKVHYADSILSNYKQEKFGGLLSAFPGNLIYPELEWRDFPYFDNAVSYNFMSGNQIRGFYYVFNYSFRIPGGGEFLEKAWTEIKQSFKNNPFIFMNFFNTHKEILKPIKKYFGVSFGVTSETEDFLNLEFEEGLTTQFKKIYDKNPSDHLVYQSELLEEAKKGTFLSWGYDEEFGEKVDRYDYEFYGSRLCKDFMKWVWHHEYGSECVQVLKKAVHEINSW